MAKNEIGDNHTLVLAVSKCGRGTKILLSVLHNNEDRTIILPPLSSTWVHKIVQEPCKCLEDGDEGEIPNMAEKLQEALDEKKD